MANISTNWGTMPAGGDSLTYGATGSFGGSLLDDILYQISQSMGEETEGQFAEAEALFENAALVLGQIQSQVPADQQADVLAEYLRESGFSSHVVEQTLGIPREEVDAVLMAAGYNYEGQPISDAEKLGKSKDSNFDNAASHIDHHLRRHPDANNASGGDRDKLRHQVAKKLGYV